MNSFTREMLNQVAEESLTVVQSHPYYGLRDQKGWMTRYPLQTEEGLLVWTRKEVKEYIKAGGSFDSYGVWGATPYGRKELDAGMPAYKLGEYCSEIKRAENLPFYRGDFPIHDSLDLNNYLILSKGAERKRLLSSWGIEFTGSLFGLAYKSNAWMWRKVQRELSKKGAIKILSSRINRLYLPEKGEKVIFDYDAIDLHNTNPSLDGEGYKLMRNCIEKYNKRMSLQYNCYMRRKYHHTKMTTKKGHELYMKYFEKNCDVINKYSYSFETSYTSVGDVCVFDNLFYVREKLSRNIKQINVKNWRGYYVAKVQDRYFVWLPGNFKGHVENVDFRYAIKTMESKLYGSKAKEKFFADHIISLRVFVALTSSCFAGTKSFLRSNAQHLYNLLSPYQNWEDVPNEIMDIEWELTAAFAESFRYRF